MLRQRLIAAAHRRTLGAMSLDKAAAGAEIINVFFILSLVLVRSRAAALTPYLVWYL
jgi:hypothetical protein